VVSKNSNKEYVFSTSNVTIFELINDQSKKAKAKVETIGKSLSNNSLTTAQLIAFAEKANDTEKATCIEALEYATKQNPELADETVWVFVTKALTHDAPRVKWESAKVIANIAHRFSEKLDKAVGNLLVNSEHNGTVVRWATALALGEILKLKTKHNKELLPTIEAIYQREQDSGVKKKYLDALKKVKN
jgi:hypothetical protein